MAKVIIEIEDVEPAAALELAGYTIRMHAEGEPADGKSTDAMLIGVALCRALLDHAEDDGATVVDHLDPRWVH